ncbi:MAG: 3D-(3,5/4)-trihydroxycyclohexane-1,2-dione acylhydrolase (decyclizing) [Christensenellaceae bacterium]|jgi:3D-(3,5/4)-trihydroxycyclohexane-1,2-dione acylhydrolase (decyclizing)
MKTIRMTVGQAVVKFLNQQYVEFDGTETPFVDGVFTIFGHGSVVGLGQALEEDPGHLRVYQGRNEQGMAHVATGFAKQHNRRKIIACCSSIGPGATNMVTAALTATINNLPLLLLPSDSFATRQPDPVLQQIEQPYDFTITGSDCFRPVSRYWDRVSRPGQLMTAMINAMRVLTDTANCGTATVSIPQDVQGESFDFPEDFFQKRVHRIPRRLADEVERATAVEMIMQSKRPLFVSGGGVRYSEAGDALQSLCEELKIPYAETQAGKSATLGSSPMNLGGIGISGSLAANTIAETADLIVGVGTRFNDFVTGSKSVYANPNVKFVTINTSEFHAEKMDAMRVVGDARINIEAIGKVLKEKGYKPSYGETEIADLMKEWEEERQKVLNTVYTGDGFVPVVPCWTQEIMDDYLRDIGGTITETNGVKLVMDVIEKDAMVVTAAGSLPADMQRLWKTDAKYTYNVEYGASCMGFEIAATLGAKLAAPNQDAYCLLGDGSFLMLNSEIPTAIQEGAKITIVVFDNAAFGCINNLQMGNGIGSLATEFRHRNPETGKMDGPYVKIDYAKVGEGYGMKGYTAKTPEELKAALEDAKKQEKSCLIDAKVLPKTMAEGYKSWWHVGVASTSKSAAVKDAYESKEEWLKKARMY